LDMAGNYEKMSRLCQERIAPDLQSMGLSLTLFYIENISLPPEVEEALDKLTKMGVIGDLNKYTQYQTAEAIPAAAANPGGIAGIGAGLGVGIGIANQMAGAMAGGAGHAGTPPAVPTGANFFVAINNQQAGPFDMAALQQK